MGQIVRIGLHCHTFTNLCIVWYVLVLYGMVWYCMNFAFTWDINRVDSAVIVLCYMVWYCIMVWHGMLWYNTNQVLLLHNNGSDS